MIGNHLVSDLRASDYEVIGLDLPIRDYDDYVRADITYYEDLLRVFKENSVHAVIHMAGEVGRIVGEMYPQKMLHVNDIGTLNLIRLCTEYEVKLIYFSTSEVYGHLFDRIEIVDEDDLERYGSPFITTNIYAMSKLFGESLVKHYVDNYGLEAVTIRPFMVYGPGEYPSKYRSAISNFVYNGIKGNTITVHRGTMRAWCYISDFIDGVKIVLEHPFAGCYEAFNIGSDEYHSMEEVAILAITLSGGQLKQIKLVDPPEKFLSKKKIASIKKITKLGYKPKINLEMGIKNVVDWQKNEIFKKN